jgi:hypothetical protein
MKLSRGCASRCISISDLLVVVDHRIGTNRLTTTGLHERPVFRKPMIYLGLALWREYSDLCANFSVKPLRGRSAVFTGLSFAARSFAYAGICSSRERNLFASSPSKTLSATTKAAPPFGLNSFSIRLTSVSEIGNPRDRTSFTASFTATLCFSPCSFALVKAWSAITARAKW